MSALEGMGVDIRLAAKVEEVVTEDGRVKGVRANGVLNEMDEVISTVPTPFVNAMVPDLPEDWKRRYAAIPNIGVACVVFKLKRSVTPHFWVNISDDSIDDSRHHRVLQSPADRRHRRLRALLHAGDEPEMGLDQR